ncbi:MAG: hypothetical protein WKF93_02185 [Acidimicrobiales bacterium]
MFAAMFAAVVWHAWIGVVLFLSVFPMLAFLVVGYINKVVRPKYPTKR